MFMMDSGQARKFEDLENSHKSSTVTLASIKESLGMDVDQKRNEICIDLQNKMKKCIEIKDRI